MDKLSPPYDVLRFSRHAQWRMHHRHISLDEVYQAIHSGRNLRQGGNVLHYDPVTWVGVVINWPSHTIVTVMNVWLTMGAPDFKQTIHRERR
jgi:hypothetical protein